MQYSAAIERVSKELGIPKTVVDKVYMHHWRYVWEQFKGIPFKKGLTRDEFNKYYTAVLIPEVGTLYCSWENYEIQSSNVHKANENKTAEHRPADDDECL